MFAVDEVDVVPDSFSSHENGLTSSSDPITHALSSGRRMDDLLIPADPAQSASLGWRQTSALLGEPSSPDRQLSLGQSSKQSLGRQASLEHSAPLHRQTSLGLLASHSQPGSASQGVSLGLNSLSAGRPVSVGAGLSVGAPLSGGAPQSVGRPISSGGPVLDGGHLSKHGPTSWGRPHSGAGTDTRPMSAGRSEGFGLFEELQSALELQPAGAGARSRSGGAAHVPSTAGPQIDLDILARGGAGTASHTQLDPKDIGQQGATPGAGAGKGAAAGGAWWEQANAKRGAQAVRDQHSGKGSRPTQPAAVAPAPAPAPAPRKRQAPQTAAEKAADELWDMEVPVKPARRAKRKSGEGTGAQAGAGTAAGGSGADAKPAPKRSKAFLSSSDPLGQLSERLTFGGQVRWPAGRVTQQGARQQCSRGRVCVCRGTCECVAACIPSHSGDPACYAFQSLLRLCKPDNPGTSLIQSHAQVKDASQPAVAQQLQQLVGSSVALVASLLYVTVEGGLTMYHSPTQALTKNQQLALRKARAQAAKAAGYKDSPAAPRLACIALLTVTAQNCGLLRASHQVPLAKSGRSAAADLDQAGPVFIIPTSTPAEVQASSAALRAMVKGLSNSMAVPFICCDAKALLRELTLLGLMLPVNSSIRAVSSKGLPSLQHGD